MHVLNWCREREIDHEEKSEKKKRECGKKLKTKWNKENKHKEFMWFGLWLMSTIKFKKLHFHLINSFMSLQYSKGSIYRAYTQNIILIKSLNGGDSIS